MDELNEWTIPGGIPEDKVGDVEEMLELTDKVGSGAKLLIPL